jgi:hypothetical protein
VVDHIQASFKHENVAIACIYCNYKEQATVYELVASLLKQLVQDQPAPSDNIRSVYTNHIDNHTRPTFGELTDILKSEIGTYTQAFVVVDGLDEFLERDQGYLIAQLEALASNVKLMVTSRPLLSIEGLFQGAKRLDIRASSEDVQRYIEGRFLREPRLLLHAKTDHTLRESIANKITVNVRGMYVSLALVSF